MPHFRYPTVAARIATACKRAPTVQECSATLHRRNGDFKWRNKIVAKPFVPLVIRYCHSCSITKIAIALSGKLELPTLRLKASRLNPMSQVTLMQWISQSVPGGTSPPYANDFACLLARAAHWVAQNVIVDWGFQLPTSNVNEQKLGARIKQCTDKHSM
jgi:hypothetical protein